MMHTVTATDNGQRITDNGQPITDIEAILSGPEYFKCDKTHTRMKKEECIKRQKGVRRPLGNGRTWQDVPPECQGCEQGEEIALSVDRSRFTDKKKNGKRRTENEIKEEEMEGNKVCKIEGCDKPVEARDLCIKHYLRWLYDPHRKLEPNEPVCSVSGCQMRTKAKGLCKTHYETGRLGNLKPADGLEKARDEKPEISGKLPFKGVVLNFDEYPDLLKELEEKAQEEFRSIELQSLFLIKKGLEDGESSN